ncbi:MAG: CoA-binding protein [Nitrospirae bacterium]|nr:CoA-binding protein [Nitrospirota bacterium]
MDQSKEQKILQKYKTIAVVGLSTNSEKPAHFVPKYLKEQGYTIIGINPSAKGDILGQKVYSSLREIPEKVDIVNIFRPSGEVPGIVEEAIAIGAKVIWMQEEIIHPEAAARAEKAGLEVVMNRCMMKAHRQSQADFLH